MELDIETIRTKLAKPRSFRRKGSTKKGFVWKIKENGFYNQVTVEFIDSFSKKSMKIFPNGTIHITGCSDVWDGIRVTHQLEFVLSLLCEVPIKIGNFELFMVNTNFTMNSRLNLQKVIELMNEKKFQVSFNPEVYSAVKVKFRPEPHMKQITASIFSSGCVLVTGAVSLSEINASYAMLIDTLKNASMVPNEKLVVFDNFMGHSITNHWIKLLDTM